MTPCFKPWRRTIGIAMLVMACVLMAGWVRSFQWTDKVTPHANNDIRKRFDFLASHQGGIEWRIL